MPVPTTQVFVQSVRRPPVQEAEENKQHLKRKRLTEEAALASSVAARELRAVVSLASRRGLNAEEIFQHFVVDDLADARAGEESVGCPCAGKKDVIKGMEGLGISLSEEAAGLLVQTIVRSSDEPPGQHSTLPAANAGQPRRILSEPLRVPNERGRAAVAGGAESTKPRRARETSSQRSAADGKTLPPLLRQYITAEDLWNFASRTCPPGGKAQSSSGDATTPVERGEPGAAGVHEERFPLLSQKEAKEVEKHVPQQTAHGDAGPSSTRNRARNGPSIGGGGSGIIAANGAQQANRRYNQQTFGNHQASLLMMPSLPATGNGATALNTYGPAAAKTPGNLEETAGEGAPRPHSMSTQVGSIDSSRKRDLEQCDGTLLGPRRRQTFPACVGTVAVAPAAVPTVFQERAEVASFPCDNPVLEATGSKDRVFHVDR